MLKLKKLTVKNFMSFGNIAHEVDLDDELLTLVLGENRDTGIVIDGSGSNGAGKSSLICAISYVFFDKALGNIKKDNLVNKLNEKNMEVTIDFTKNNDSYRIIRGRKPNVLKFFVNNHEFDESKAQGENRETQPEIEKVIGINYELFKEIITLSAQNEPFLKLGAAKQREIIEELLGITQLSSKAEILRENIKETQKLIDQELFKNQTIQNLNEKTLSQITRLQKISDKWDKDHIALVSDLTESISGLEQLDVQNELKLHSSKKDLTDISTKYNGIEKDLKQQERSKRTLVRRLDELQEHLAKATIEKKCYACGQAIDDNHQIMVQTLIDEKIEKEKEISNHNETIKRLTSDLDLIEAQLMKFQETEEPFYSTEKEAWEHNSTIENLKYNLSLETVKINPYIEQIDNLKKENLSKIDNSVLEELKTTKLHQEFLLKILTNKDSFVRKKIIDQSLTFLNFRLDHYLTEIGLEHNVKFQNDLTVSIEKMGREYDFDNLSRGQKTRLIISLNLAFRDVFESLNFPINMIFIDELIDNGLDGAGVDCALKVFKEMARSTKKSIFLVSHREEIKPRVNKTLKVIMENGFSSISHDEED
jgi:DNA repair exonuclease SbcCD ATPase subunit